MYMWDTNMVQYPLLPKTPPSNAPPNTTIQYPPTINRNQPFMKNPFPYIQKNYLEMNIEEQKNL